MVKSVIQITIAFAPKRRRQSIHGEIESKTGKMTWALCKGKGMAVIEAGTYPDHIRILASVPPKRGVSEFPGYLRGKVRSGCLTNLHA